MTRREDETWKIIGTFVIVCALLTALIIVLRGRPRPARIY